MSIFGDIWDSVTGAANPNAHYSTDPNAFEYGGRKGFADEEANQFRDRANATQDRGGPGIDRTYSDASRQQGDQSRDWQLNSNVLNHDAAYGKTPSAAEALMSKGTNDAIKAQYALANSARGNPYATAAANRQAAFSGASLMQGSIQDKAAMRANEMAKAREDYAASSQAQRAQDLQQQGMDLDTATKLAQLEEQQRALNDQTMLGLEQQRGNVYAQQLGAQGNEEQIASGVAQGDAGRRQQLFTGLLGMAGGAAGGLAGMASDARAKQGIMSANAPAPVFNGTIKPAPVFNGTIKPAPVYGVGAQPAPVYGTGAQPMPVYGVGAQPMPVYGTGAQPMPVWGDDSSGVGIASDMVGKSKIAPGGGGGAGPWAPNALGAPGGGTLPGGMTSGFRIPGMAITNMGMYGDHNMSNNDMMALYGGSGNAAQHAAMAHTPMGGGAMISDKREKAAAQAEGMRQGIMASLSVPQNQGQMSEVEQGAMFPQMPNDSGGAARANEVNSLTRAYGDSLNPYSYEYRNSARSPNGQPGRHLGVMAQDVERAPVVGQQIVQTAPDGTKMLNLPELTSANTALLGDVHRRLSKVEEKVPTDDYGYMQAFAPAARSGGY